MSELPGRLAAALERELDEGESVLWSGQSAPDLIARQARRDMIMATVFGGLFAALFGSVVFVKWLERASEQHQPGLSTPLSTGNWIGIGISALIVLIAFIFGWFYAEHTKQTARETVFAITEKRAIILHVGSKGERQERDYRADELLHLSRVERADGRGDIRFETARGVARGSARGPNGATWHGFVAIKDVLDVERLLRERFGEA